MTDHRHEPPAAHGHALRWRSLNDLLGERASLGSRAAYTFLEDGEREGEALTFGGLDHRVRALAAVLRDRGLAGQRVLILFAPGLDYIVAFLACLAAGTVAVPAYPALSRRAAPRLRAILASARPTAVLTASSLLHRSRASLAEAPEAAELLWLTADEPTGAAPAWDELPGAAAGPETLAFLQYTSGSTGDPKGVMVRHGDLLHNQEMIRRAFAQDESSVVVGWLPLYHDMGLIGNVLQPLYLGARCVLMAPAAFLQKPVRWLRAISRYRGTTSGGPDFGYAVCAAKVRPEERGGLDLSSWSVAYDGSEPVRAATLDRFVETFGPHGFRREAFYPCYGLAEATLFVAGGQAGAEPVVRRFDPDLLALGRARPGSEGEVALVGCGRAWLDQEIAIADPATGRRLAAGAVGEIWIAGGSVAAGYWNRPEETARVFRARLAGEPEAGPFLRTGDLGFFAPSPEAGEPPELFVAGRLKDLIIVRGRNVYPQDVEATAGAAGDALRTGEAAAFSVEVGGEERLVVVHEIERRREDEGPATAAAVRRAVAEEHELSVHEVVLVRAGTLPKTSSGKVRRRACRDEYLEDALTVIARSGAGEPRTEDATGPADAAAGGAALDRDALLALPAARRWTALVAALRQSVAATVRSGVAAIDPESPLTALGVDSLAAAELHRELEERFGVPVPYRLLLEGAGIAELARGMLDALAGAAERKERAREDGTAETEPAIAEPVREIPLSPGQKALWLLQRRVPESAAWTIAAAARVVPGTAALDPDALARALARLVERHPLLAARIVEGDDGEPRLALPDPGRRASPRALLHVVDERGAGEGAAEPSEAIRAAAFGPLDLAAGPPLRVTLVRSGSGTPAASGPILVIAVHHLVTDFWSLGVLARDLGALYGRELDPAAPEPGPAPGAASSARHSRRQERLADPSDPRGAALWNGWREALAGAPLELDLPTDRLRPPSQRFRGGEVRLRLEAGATGVHGLARTRGATFATVLLAAWSALLHRVTGRDDLLVGVPTAGRGGRGAQSAALDDSVGYFVNLVPVRSRLPGTPSFTAHLDGIGSAVVAAVEGADLPFPALAQRLQPVRDPSRPPVVQALFVPQQVRRPEEEPLLAFALGVDGVRLGLGPDLTPRPDGGTVLEVVALESPAAQVDLELAVGERDGEIDALLRYDADLFARATVERWLEAFGVLLDHAGRSPDTPVTALHLLSDGARRHLLADWGAPAPAGPTAEGPALLHAGILGPLGTARRHPAAPALAWEGRTWSYGALAARATSIADRLHELGVGPEVRVAVLLPRGPDLVAALLGVLAAGGAYVPLDPAYPAERLAFMVADSGARVLVTATAVADRVPETAAALPVVSLDPVGAADAASVPPSEPADLSGLHPENLSHVIYTSGSTGRPKGVAIRHGGAAALLDWARHRFAPRELAGVVAVTSVCFDLSIFEIFAPLAAGGTVLLVPDALALLDGGAAPAGPAATLLNTVPSAAAELVRAEAVPASARTVCLAGEPLRGSLVDQLHEAGVREVWNLYGPSEDTTYSTEARVPRAADRHGEPTIGRPLAGSRAVVVDRSGRPVPAGVVGELLLGGPKLARGYLARPALTAERFGPDPFSRRPGERLYRTGDLVRWGADGELEFLGRLDQQVKIRGFRIELGEVEVALEALPGVGEAVAMARLVGGETALVGYVAPGDGAAPAALDPRTVRDGVRERLPESMVPSVIVVLAALPRTPNGKVDRKALPPVDSGEPAKGTSGGADRGRGGPPATAAERLVARTWAEVLPALEEDAIGREDDFFRLGGHSLLVPRVAARLGRELGAAAGERAGEGGRALPLAPFFEETTVAGLARRLERLPAAAARPASADPGAEPIRRLPRPLREAPPSPVQERLWFLEQLAPGSAAYVMAAAVELEGALRPAALAGAVTALVRRQAALRTTLPAVSGRPVQRISPPAAWALPVVDLSGLPHPRSVAAARSLAEADARRPFDLAEGPLLRTLVVRRGHHDHLLLVAMHHAVSDGWSVAVLVRELGALYAACLTGRPAETVLPELPVQYADFAAWQRERLSEARIAGEIAWWRGALEGAPASAGLPVDRPRQDTRRGRGRTLRRAIPRELARRVDAFARTADATPFMVLLAAFGALVREAATAGSGAAGAPSDLVVGSPVAGRLRPETEGLIGAFVNTLPLRLDLTGRPGLRVLVDRARQAVLGAQAHQEVPFERLVEALAPERDLGRTPLFDVMLVFQGAEPELPALGDLAARALPVDAGGAKFDLTLSIEAEGGTGGYRTAWEYDRDLFDGASPALWADQLERLLDAALAAPEVALAELPVWRAESWQEWTRRRERLAAAAGTSATAAQVRHRPRATGRSTAQMTATETRIANLWQELLPFDPSRAPIGPDDDFFRIGGHSLLAARVAARLREDLADRRGGAGAGLPIRVLFESPTVAALARRIDREEAGQTGGPGPTAASVGASAAPPGPSSGPERRVAPLSFGQERLWFLDRLEGDRGRAAYVMPAAVRLTGALDRPALARALAAVVGRHDVLRAVFLEPGDDAEGDAPVQEVRYRVGRGRFLRGEEHREEAAILVLPVVDLGRFDRAGAEARARELAAAEVRRGFDLAEGPLARFLLLALSRDEHLLVVALHHAVSDGWSVGVLTRELGALYRAFHRGDPPGLPPLPLQYADVARWQRRRFAAGELDAALERQARRLRGIEPLRLPVDRPRAAVRELAGARIPVALPAARVASLETLADRTATTLFTVLLAAFQALLARITGQDDVAVGAPVANRAHPDLEGLIGFFVNTLVSRATIPGATRFGRHLAAVREDLLEAQTDQELPFEALVAELRPERRLDATPLFQAMLVLQNTPEASVEEAIGLPGIAAAAVPLPSGGAKFDLTLTYEPATDGGLSGTLEYAAALFDRTTARRLAGWLESLLEQAVADPERPVGDLALLAAGERHQLLVAWTDSTAPAPAPGGPALGGRAYVLDARLEPVPRGVAGELVLADTPGTHGFPDRGETGEPAVPGRAGRDAERLVPDRFGRSPGGRLQRTGELARHLPDGRIERLGRIEPAATGERAETTGSVPAEPAAGAGGGARTPLEGVVAGLWADVLGIDRPETVERNESFFDRGGHSLLAARLLARLRRTLGVDLPLRELFETPTVAGIAAAIETRRRRRPEVARGAEPPLVPLPRDGRALPASFAQQSIWLHDRLRAAAGGAARAAYNVPAAVELTGALDRPALAEALRRVVARHETLRTTLSPGPGEALLQTIHEPVATPLPLVDLARLPESAREPEAHRLALAEALRPFDLERGPLVRLRLIATATGPTARHLLLLTLHHAIADAPSIAVMIRELAAGYRERVSGGPTGALPELPVQYADWASWQRRRLEGAALDEHLAFWRRRLGAAAGAADGAAAKHPLETRLGADREPAGGTDRGARRVWEIDAGLADRLDDFARRQGVTLFMLLLSGFQGALHRTTGETEVVVGTAAAGRDRVEIEELIGCFTNMLPLRASFSDDPTLRVLLERGRHEVLGAFDHQDLPFDRLVGELRLGRRGEGGSPLGIAFGVQDALGALPELPGVSVRPLDLDYGVTRLPLTLWVSRRDGGELAAAWTFRTDLFDEGTVRRLHERWRALLESALDDPDRPITELAIRGPSGERGGREKRWDELRSERARRPRRRRVTRGVVSPERDAKPRDGDDDDE